MQERQLHRVADLLDLPDEATDVLVADVGHLLQHQVLDLRLRHALVRVAGLGVDQQRVARLERLLGQQVGEQDHPLLVRVPDHQRAKAAALDVGGEHLTQRAHLAGAFEAAGLDHGERLVEPQRLAAAQRRELDRG